MYHRYAVPGANVKITNLSPASSGEPRRQYGFDNQDDAGEARDREAVAPHVEGLKDYGVTITGGLVLNSILGYRRR